MLRHIYKSKIHKAVVTQTELFYTGSITIPLEVMQQADLVPGERVQVLNINTGDRLETYVIEGKANDGCICLNGPAARKALVGDEVVIISYCLLDENELDGFTPSLVILGSDNKVAESR